MFLIFSNVKVQSLAEYLFNDTKYEKNLKYIKNMKKTEVLVHTAALEHTEASGGELD